MRFDLLTGTLTMGGTSERLTITQALELAFELRRWAEDNQPNCESGCKLNRPHGGRCIFDNR